MFTKVTYIQLNLCVDYDTNYFYSILFFHLVLLYSLMYKCLSWGRGREMLIYKSKNKRIEVFLLGCAFLFSLF